MSANINSHYSEFYDTVLACTSRVLENDDDLLMWNIFENFHIGCEVYLADPSLEKLKNSGTISDDTLLLANEIYLRWKKLDFEWQRRGNEWTAPEVRLSKDWNRLFELCDNLISLLPLPKR